MRGTSDEIIVDRLKNLGQRPSELVGLSSLACDHEMHRIVFDNVSNTETLWAHRTKPKETQTCIATITRGQH